MTIFIVHSDPITKFQILGLPRAFRRHAWEREYSRVRECEAAQKKFGRPSPCVGRIWIFSLCSFSCVCWIYWDGPWEMKRSVTAYVGDVMADWRTARYRSVLFVCLRGNILLNEIHTNSQNSFFSPNNARQMWNHECDAWHPFSP